MISPSQGRYLHTGQRRHKINAQTNIHALSGIRNHDPAFERAKTVHALDRAATVIGMEESRRHNFFPELLVPDYCYFVLVVEVAHLSAYVFLTSCSEPHLSLSFVTSAHK
jgi:hypothetical protein